MKRILYYSAIVCLSCIVAVSFVFAREERDCDKKDKVKIKTKSGDRWIIDWDSDCLDDWSHWQWDWRWDLSDLEELKALEGLEALEGLKALEGLEALEDLESLEDLDFDFEFDFDFDFDRWFKSWENMSESWCHIPSPPIPTIALPLPPLPPTPSVHFDGYWGWGCDDWNVWLDEDELSEEEELHLHALSALRKLDGDESIPILESILEEEEHPAIRVKAVSILGEIDDDRVLPILGSVAKHDPDYRVRKRAVIYLGRSGDKRALEILKEILEN